jgi:signal recognition particle GTPase
MVVGVNGVGKTTTRQTRIPIKKAGYKVVLAGDTFALLQ